MTPITPDKLPDCLGQIMDDYGTQDLPAQDFLRQLNILDKIPDPLTLSMTAVFGSYDRHPTHWIAFMRIAGHEVQDWNGYSVCFCPKRVGPESILMDGIKEDFTKMGISYRFIGSLDNDSL